MNNAHQKIIDSHVHLDHIHKRTPQRIRWMQELGIIPISWAFAMHIETRSDLKKYLRTQADTIQELSRNGFKCFFLSGIHPRNIPSDLKAEDVKTLLAPFLDDPLCLGIGEIGLETGTQREQEILAAQLDMEKTLRHMGKKFGIHTPRNNKPEITKKLLSALSLYPGIETFTVIDHCTPETIDSVLKKGYWAGVTLSPVKASLKDLEKIVSHHPEDLQRILCNTDSGTVFYEDIYMLYRSDAFLPDMRNKLTFENAFYFFTPESSEIL
ncbi:TatD family hydrolase [Desulfonema magnum]|uniref:TatD related DNase n=1 Tax=Desulfonema magnum TaxID=45655 RepID=A0A975GSH9_9BACT|nr:TatD family hydrolase [Desulfonema magnum]QTA91932.1 TatD related DNase [Desulfonema magnum]